MADERDTQGRTRMNKAALAFFLPFVLSPLAYRWFGFAGVAALLACLFAGPVVYLRYVKKRSWHSIVWGAAAADE